MTDLIIVWSEVRKGDLVLSYGELAKVVSVYPDERPDWIGTRITVTLTDGSTSHRCPSDLTAVRRADRPGPLADLIRELSACPPESVPYVGTGSGPVGSVEPVTGEHGGLYVVLSPL